MVCFVGMKSAFIEGFSVENQPDSYHAPQFQNLICLLVPNEEFLQFSLLRLFGCDVCLKIPSLFPPFALSFSPNFFLSWIVCLFACVFHCGHFLLFLFPFFPLSLFCSFLFALLSTLNAEKETTSKSEKSPKYHCLLSDKHWALFTETCRCAPLSEDKKSLSCTGCTCANTQTRKSTTFWLFLILRKSWHS